LDLQTSTLRWSLETYHILEVDPSLAPDLTNAINYYAPAVRSTIRTAVEQAIEFGQPYDLELPLTTAGGKNIWIRTTGQPEFRDATCVRLFGIFQDITERKRAEEAVRLANDQLEIRVQQRTEELAAANRELSNEIQERKEIERQLRIQAAAMDSAANGIIITDSTGVILWSNLAVTQMTGYDYGELVGQSTRIFNSGSQDADFYSRLWNTVLAGKVWHGETINRRKDGSLYVEEQTITPIRNEDGQVSYFIAIKQDVTERKFMYAQLEESNRELTVISHAERQQRLLAEGLAESSVALNMNLELDTVLDHIFEQTRRTIPYQRADIVLIEAGKANVVRQWGARSTTVSPNESLPLEEFPLWKKISATKSVVTIPDTDLEKQWNNYLGLTGIRSYLGAPLIYNDQVIGIIDLTSDQANTFEEEMANHLRAFAAPAAVAIQNARLYEDEQENRRIAETLSAASVALAKTLDIQMVMETILDYEQSILPCDVAFVIMSEGDERYRIRTVRAAEEYSGIRDSLQDRRIDLLNEPIVSCYFENNESTFLSDSRLIPGWNPPVELSSLNCWLGMPLESMGKTIGIVVVANATPNSFARNQIQLLETVVRQAVVALQNAWLFEQVRSGRERLQQLSRHLVEIQENERKYIARELHDETSQSLTSLKLGLQLIEQKAAGHKGLLEQVKKLQLLADETLESLHHLAVNLRPASLDHLALADALTGLIESTRQRSGLTAHFKVMGSLQQDAFLNEELETSIYRIVQESLTNVVRHAHAEHVDVILDWQRDKIVIIIEDDGVGIEMEKAREAGHLGLIGMQERAEMLGGKLVVDSTPQVGTTLVVEIPYAHSNTYSR
jgi:PAS domain S-box-containing protein